MLCVVSVERVSTCLIPLNCLGLISEFEKITHPPEDLCLILIDAIAILGQGEHEIWSQPAARKATRCPNLRLKAGGEVPISETVHLGPRDGVFVVRLF